MEKTFTVNGMKCPHCKANVENALKGLAGVNDAVVSLAGHSVDVDYDEKRVTVGQMKEAVDNAGHYEFEI